METNRTPLTYTDTPDQQGFCGTVRVYRPDEKEAVLAVFRICEDEVADAYDDGTAYVVRTQGNREWRMDKATGQETLQDAPPPGFSGSFKRIEGHIPSEPTE
jgi:hypothetical protein